MHTKALARAEIIVRSQESNELEAKDGAAGKEAQIIKPATEVRLSVTETRLANLMQSMFCFIVVAAMPAVRLIPTSVIWGYFAFLSLESLPGSELVERVAFLLTDPRRRHLVFEKPHAACLQTVPTRTIAGFTAIQVLLVAGIWALVYFGQLAGIAFPIPIMLLVPVRRYLLPRVFEPRHLTDLDAAEYEEAPGMERGQAIHAVAELSGRTDGEVIEARQEVEAEAVELQFHGVDVVHRVEVGELRERVQRLQGV